jgi:hypothetical protein
MKGGGTMPPNVFDQANRYGVQPDPIGYFRWLIPGLDPALGFHGWLDTRTVPCPGERDRTCDTVAHLAAEVQSGPQFAVVNEFETDPESEILDRALEYLVRVRRVLRHGPQRREKFQVIATLVNLTGAPQPDTLEMGLPGQDAPALRFHLVTRNLREEDAALTLDGIASRTVSRCLLSWISLMQGGAEPDIMERWKAIAATEPNGAHRATYGLLVTIFAELTGCADLWYSALKEWDMRESTLVNEWKAEWMAEGRAEGEAKGRAEGEAEGEAKGRAEGERSALLLVLGQKFHTPVPRDLAEAVAAQSDSAVLTRWLTIAIDADSLEAFRSAITS